MSDMVIEYERLGKYKTHSKLSILKTFGLTGSGGIFSSALRRQR